LRRVAFSLLQCVYVTGSSSGNVFMDRGPLILIATGTGTWIKSKKKKREKKKVAIKGEGGRQGDLRRWNQLEAEIYC